MALNKRQLTLIEYMLANPMLPETVCAANCGVPNSTYFNWKKAGEFTEELNKRIKAQWADSERAAVETMLSLCREGKYEAAKYILDNLGYKPVDKIQAELHTDIVIEIGE